MPLEGVSSPGPLIPNHKLAEAAALGAFEAKVEQNEMIKKANDEEEEKKRQQEEESSETGEESNAYQEELSQAATLLRSKADSDTDRSIEYTLKFNKYTELVELIDLKTGDMIQSIPPRDLIDLISSLRYTSGLFIDNEI